MIKLSIATAESGSIRDGVASTPGEFGVEPSFFEPGDPVLGRSGFKDLFQTRFSVPDVLWLFRFFNRWLSSRAPLRFDRHSRWKISRNVRVAPRFTVPSMTTREYLADCLGRRSRFENLCERCCSMLDGRMIPSVSTHFPELFATGKIQKQAVDALRTIFAMISVLNGRSVGANRVRVISIPLGNRVDEVRCVPLNPNTSTRRSHRYAFRAILKSREDAQTAALRCIEKIVDFLPEDCNLAIRVTPDPMGVLSDWGDLCSMDTLLTSDPRLCRRVGFDCDFGSLARIAPAEIGSDPNPLSRLFHARIAVTGKGDFLRYNQFSVRDLSAFQKGFNIYKEIAQRGVATGFVTINMPKAFWPRHFRGGLEILRQTLERI